MLLTINDDGLKDIVLVYSDDNSVGVDLNAGDETFVRRSFSLSALSPEVTSSITFTTAADLNSDRKMEVIVLAERDLIVLTTHC